MDRITALQERLEGQADPSTKAWWERYLKHAIAFRGVKMADIRARLHAWLGEEAVTRTLTPAEQKELALELLREVYSEDKLAGILLLQEVLLPAGAVDWRTVLPQFAALFRDGHICECNTCDWFCMKVLGPLAQREGEACA